MPHVAMLVYIDHNKQSEVWVFGEAAGSDTHQHSTHTAVKHDNTCSTQYTMSMTLPHLAQKYSSFKIHIKVMLLCGRRSSFTRFV